MDTVPNKQVILISEPPMVHSDYGVTEVTKFPLLACKEIIVFAMDLFITEKIVLEHSINSTCSSKSFLIKHTVPRQCVQEKSPTNCQKRFMDG